MSLLVEAKSLDALIPDLPPLSILIGFGRVGELCNVDPATPWRWATRGVAVPKSEAAPTGRLYLASWLLPGRRVTTEAAVREFIARLTAARQPGPAAPAPRSPAKRARDQARVDRELDEFGIA